MMLTINSVRPSSPQGRHPTLPRPATGLSLPLSSCDEAGDHDDDNDDDDDDDMQQCIVKKSGT